MVKTVYIADLRDGDDLLNEPFLLQDVVRRETKDGRPFLLGTFRDKTGQLGGVFWDLPPDVEAWVRPGMVALVTGRVNNYKSALQITATDLNPQTADSMEQFLPSSRRTRQEMVAELRQVIEGIERPWRDLVSQILLADSFLNEYASAPAARSMHHAYVGGLLEHTLSMARIAAHLADHYHYVNRDLLLSGVLLHDVGKVYEYSTEEIFAHTDDGRLVGHIVRAVTMVEQAATSTSGLSEEQLRQLVHLIASHHGTHEWGSPVRPKTLEAILLHQIDLLDSRVQGFFDHLRNDLSDGAWTSKASPMLQTTLRRPSGFE